MGDAKNDELRVGFDSRLKLRFCGSKVTSDAGLLAYRELDEALGLTEMGADLLTDSRQGSNKQHLLVPLLRQSTYSRLAGYEDVNDAERLAVDPASDVDNRTSRNGQVNTNADGKTDLTYSANENTKGDFPSFMIVTGSSGGMIDLSTDGTLTAEHDKIRQEGRAESERTGKEKTTVRTGSSNLVGSLLGDHAWTVNWAIYESGGNLSLSFTNDFEFGDDIDDDDEENSEGEPEVTGEGGGEGGGGGEGEGEGDTSSGKITSRDKVTTGHVVRKVEGNSNSTFARHEESLETTKLGDAGTSTSLVFGWKEEYRKETNNVGNTATHTVDAHGKYTKTFTSAGSEPGDRQTLVITNQLHRVELVATKHDVTNFYLENLGTGYTFPSKVLFVHSIDQTRTETQERSRYRASHTLGSDGASATGGTLSATHHRTFVITTDQIGKYQETWMQENWDGRTAEASEKRNTERNGQLTKIVIDQTESGSYHEGPLGRVYTGEATTTETVTTGRQVKLNSEGKMPYFGNEQLETSYSEWRDVIDDLSTVIRTTRDTIGGSSPNSTVTVQRTKDLTEESRGKSQSVWTEGDDSKETANRKFVKRTNSSGEFTQYRAWGRKSPGNSAGPPAPYIYSWDEGSNIDPDTPTWNARATLFDSENNLPDQEYESPGLSTNSTRSGGNGEGEGENTETGANGWPGEIEAGFNDPRFRAGLALADNLLDVVQRQEELWSEINRLQILLDYSGVGEMGIGASSTTKEKMGQRIGELQLQLKALTIDDMNFRDRLENDYGDVNVPRFQWSHDLWVGGGTGGEALIEFAVYQGIPAPGLQPSWSPGDVGVGTGVLTKTVAGRLFPKAAKAPVNDGVRSANGRYLADNWHQGTFPNRTQTVNYHLAKHGKGRTATEYTRDAMDFFHKNKHLGQEVILKDGTAGIKIQTKVSVPGQKAQKIGGYWTSDGRLVTFWD